MVIDLGSSLSDSIGGEFASSIKLSMRRSASDLIVLCSVGNSLWDATGTSLWATFGNSIQMHIWSLRAEWIHAVTVARRRYDKEDSH